MLEVVTAKAYSRAGVLGNPSDGYGGKAIALSLYNFGATVRITPGEHFRITPGAGDSLEFESVREASAFFLDVGCEDGLRLLRAALARFSAWWPEFRALAPNDPRLRFSISYETSIPRQVGLAGSSAIVVAALRGLAEWFGTRIAPFDLAELALRAELEDLHHAAGAMDRVIQSYEGFMLMDLREPRTERAYSRLDVADLPPLFVAWDPEGGEVSGKAHGDLRARWLSGDPDVLHAIEEFRALVDRGVESLARRDFDAFRSLVDRNFEKRVEIFPVSERDRAMVSIAREFGGAAKLCGSGGAILGVPADGSDPEAIAGAYRARGFAFAIPRLAADPVDPP